MQKGDGAAKVLAVGVRGEDGPGLRIEPGHHVHGVALTAFAQDPFHIAGQAQPAVGGRSGSGSSRR